MLSLRDRVHETGVRQRRLHLAAEYIVDTKMREVVAPITSLDYVPLDALRPLLDPLSFDADIREYSSRFVNGTRGWVFREVEQWLLTKTDSRCRVLFGGPGFGKTAIVSRLCETRRDAVVGVHLCRHNAPFSRWLASAVSRGVWRVTSPTFCKRSSALRNLSRSCLC